MVSEFGARPVSGSYQSGRDGRRDEVRPKRSEAAAEAGGPRAESNRGRWGRRRDGAAAGGPSPRGWRRAGEYGGAGGDAQNGDAQNRDTLRHDGASMAADGVSEMSVAGENPADDQAAIYGAPPMTIPAPDVDVTASYHAGDEGDGEPGERQSARHEGGRESARRSGGRSRGRGGESRDEYGFPLFAGTPDAAAQPDDEAGAGKVGADPDDDRTPEGRELDARAARLAHSLETTASPSVAKKTSARRGVTPRTGARSGGAAAGGSTRAPATPRALRRRRRALPAAGTAQVARRRLPVRLRRFRCSGSPRRSGGASAARAPVRAGRAS